MKDAGTSEYNHPKWQALRLRVFERDGFRCTRCGDTETQLHTHHERYIPGGHIWDVPMEWLTTLCSMCHSRLHGKPLGSVPVPPPPPSPTVPQDGPMVTLTSAMVRAAGTKGAGWSKAQLRLLGLASPRAWKRKVVGKLYPKAIIDQFIAMRGGGAIKTQAAQRINAEMDRQYRAALDS